MSFGKSFMGVTAFVAGSCFLGYCLYFDKKRRSDPDYRKKVHERREKARQQLAVSKKNGRINVADLKDPVALERYFMQELILGEKDIEHDRVDSGIQHLANAMVVCGQPARLLQILQSSFTPEVFIKLLRKLREIGNKMVFDQNIKVPGINAPLEFIPQNLQLKSNVLDVDDLE